MTEPKEHFDQEQEKQCRICFDGEDDSLGRLIRPCLCRGSITVNQFNTFTPQTSLTTIIQYVHVACLNRWRKTSFTNNSFYRCPQCHYRYHFARTKAIGLATNPSEQLLPHPIQLTRSLLVVVAIITSFLFTTLVMCSSYLTTYFIDSFDNDHSSYTSSYYFFISPIDVGQDLIRAALRILRDQDAFPIEEATRRTTLTTTPSFLTRFFRRFIIGLPMIGAGSVVHMLLSLPLLGPVHWIARFRGSRSRRGSSTDVAAMIIVVLLIVGIARHVCLPSTCRIPHLTCRPGLCTRRTSSYAGSVNVSFYLRKMSFLKSIDVG